ncbi:sodium:solute symporter family transporter [Halocatena salina]|uniref:Sodium/solute symporter n=1 Tax=Halocatena salina TaxID=2934340 RepID=A0A8U0A866_9EURY|nr:sodium/solute symporter [Halocatena salina]UPM45026.1 sodium/solute symporter [Halocatena salina]
MQTAGSPTLVITEWIAIVTFALSLLGFGIYMRENTIDSASTFLADRSLPPWIQAFSTVATNLNANDFIGLAGFAYAFGVIALMTPISTAIGIVIVTIAVIPFIREIRAFSLGEWLNERFVSPVGEAYDFIWTFVWMFINMGLYIYAGSLVLNTLLGWDLWLSIGIVVLIGTTYTLLGGFGAVAGSDTIQFVLMFVPLALVLPMTLDMVGGVSGLVDGIESYQGTMTPSDHPLIADFPFGGPVAVVLLYLGFLAQSIAYWGAESQILQRPLAAESSESAQLGFLYTGIWYAVLVPLFILLPGVAAAALYPDLAVSDEAMPMLIRDIMPPGLYGVVIVGLLAGVLSSVDSQLNNFQTLLTERIYRRHVAPDRSAEHYVTVSRIAGVLFMAIAVSMAYYFSLQDSMYLVAQSLLVTIMPTFAAIAIVGGIWDRATTAGALGGIVFGIVFSVFLGFQLGHDATYIRSLYSLIAIVAVICVVSVFTTPRSGETPTAFLSSVQDETVTTVSSTVKHAAVVTTALAALTFVGATIIF